MARVMDDEDLFELERLIDLCQRPAVKEVLRGEASKIRTQLLSKMPEAAKAQTVAAGASPPAAKPASTAAPSLAAANPAPANMMKPNISFKPIQSYAWDDDGYNKPTVTVYITSGMEGVGAAKGRVKCDFTEWGFDLQVLDLNGVNHRLLKDNLDKKIVPGDSKCVVKKNRIELRLAKVKGEYAYDTWTKLESKKTKAEKEAEASKTDKDPTAGIWDIMNEMYEDGDDNMRKVIGEAMYKAKRGEKPDAKDMGAGGMGMSLDDELGED